MTVPLHSPLRVGTLNAILGDVVGHVGLSKEEVIRRVSWGPGALTRHGTPTKGASVSARETACAAVASTCRRVALRG